MLIDRFMPEFDVTERHGTLVAAPPEAAYEAVRRVDLGRSAQIQVLFALRGMPAFLLWRRRGGGRPTLTLDDLLRSGFSLLEEDPPFEIVLGLVGTFWRPTGGIRRIAGEEFEAFAEPGYAKAAWNFRVTPGTGGRCMVSTETRVRCTDDASRRKFVLYWAVVGLFSGVVRKQALKLIKRDAEGSS